MPKPSIRPSAWLAFALANCLVFASFGSAAAVTKMKLSGYLTARAEANTVLILDDRIELTSASRVLSKDASGEHPFDAKALSPGMLVEAEGQWLDKHRFFAEMLTVDLAEDEKKIHGSAYLQEEPADAAKIAAGEPSELKLDGYRLSLNAATKRAWNPAKAGQGLSVSASREAGTLAGYRVKYAGTRRKDGCIEAEDVELGQQQVGDCHRTPPPIRMWPAGALRDS